jgi:hypothetical protein
MDNYIIRIYRRDPNDPAKITGLVETVGTDEEKAFTCLEELCETLLTTRMAARKRMPQGAGARNFKE